MRLRSPLFALLLAATTAIPATTARAQDLGARLDSAVRAAERAGFSGAVRVHRGGALLLERGYGLANRATRAPFTPATVVQIGSNTKDLTAVAILQLHERGRLSIDDSLGAHVPGVPADKRGITIRHLLGHRAGFPLGIGGDFEPVGRQAFVDSAMRARLLFAPGARESYSNTGYGLLAAIVERVTGVPYERHVRDAILAPLGLRRTGLVLPGFRAEDVAHAYLAAGTDHGNHFLKPRAPDGSWWNLRGNGGMLSTVGEMHELYRALFESERLMTAATRALHFQPDASIGLAGSDGVAFFLYERDPASRTEIVVASTNAAAKAPVVRRAIAAVLGLPLDVGDGADVARRPGGAPAPAALAAVLTGFVRAVNANDAVALRRYVGEHFTSGPGAPSLDERMERLGPMRERLGEITIDEIATFADGSAEARVRTAIDGPGVFRFDVVRDGAGAYTVRRLAVMMGG